MATTAQVVLKGPNEGRSIEVLTPDALAFVARLQRQFGNRRVELLRQRDERQARLDAGEAPQFLADTETVRGSEGRGAKAPRGLGGRRGGEYPPNPRHREPKEPPTRSPRLPPRAGTAASPTRRAQPRRAG